LFSAINGWTPTNFFWRSCLVFICEERSISISTTYKRANLAGKLNLNRPSASIKQSRFIRSPHPRLPQFTRLSIVSPSPREKKEGKLDCLSHDPDPSTQSLSMRRPSSSSPDFAIP
jgi:hypothetical protein